MMIVIDTNILLRSPVFIEQLEKEGALIIVPRAVYEEIKEGANLEKLKRLKNLPNQKGQIRKKEKTIFLALKRWGLLEKKVQEGKWKVRGSYRKKLVPKLFYEAQRLKLFSLGIVDVRVVATAVAIKNEEGIHVKLKLLSLDKEVRKLAIAMGISVPPTHGWRRHFWKEEVLK